MSIWFNKRGEEYYGETEKQWWKKYIDKLISNVNKNFDSNKTEFEAHKTEFENHKNAKAIDHPDGSVTDEKIGWREVRYPVSGKTVKATLTSHLILLAGENENTQADINTHKTDTSNPHSVTAEQIGLGNVENVQQATKAEFNNLKSLYQKHTTATPEDGHLGHVQTTDDPTMIYGEDTVPSSRCANTIHKNIETHKADTAVHITEAERTNWNNANEAKHSHGNKSVLDSITSALVAAWNNAVTHISNKSNPHSVTAEQIGLSNVENVQQATKAEFNNLKGLFSNHKDLIPEDGHLGHVQTTDDPTMIYGEDTVPSSRCANIIHKNIETHKADTDNPHYVTKEQIGLGNVTNEEQATKAEFDIRTQVYPVDISKVGADNNILYVTVPNITEFSELNGKVINIYTGIYSNNKTQTVWLNVNGYGAKPIRRVIPDSSYETSTYNAYEINRYTVMQLYISGASVYWVNAVNNFANIKKNPDATDGDIVDKHLTVGYRGGIAGNYSFVSGGEGAYKNEASGVSSAAVGGMDNHATSSCAFVAGGIINKASASDSAVVGGVNNTASGNCSAVVGGANNTALAYQLKTGHYAGDGTAGATSGITGDAFIIGNGTSESASNAFRVAYDGNCYASAAMNSTGADYAEFWEWEDGNPDNEDRTGRFAVFKGNKVAVADEKSDIRKVGIVSASPAIIGDNYSDEWQGMYLKDVYGRLITEHKVYEAEYIDVEKYEEIELTAEEMSEMQEEITNDETLTDYEKAVKMSELPTTKTVKVTKQELVHEAYEADEYILNPEYDPEQEYISRERRAEYSPIGTHGKLVVADDGTCEVDGFCRPTSGGIAAKSDDGFYVMERIDETHIKVYVR